MLNKKQRYTVNIAKSMMLIALLLCSAVSIASAKVLDVRLWRAPDSTRLVFDLSGPVEHKIFTLSNPDRVVIDIDNVALNKNLGALSLKDSPIQQIRSAKKGQQGLRVVLDVKQKVKPRSFLLKKNADADDRLVIDLFDVDKATPTKKKSTETLPQGGKRDLIIAIDAGHGGEDPGAIGPRKIFEKHVVLAIAKKLAKKFNAEKGYKAVLIRKGDYYVGLAQRRKLARKANADIFISIHADAFTNPKANGSSVYALSPKGATSATAKFLANKENQSDLVGGVSLNDKDAILSGVLVDLSMAYKMSSSIHAGNKVLQQMEKISRLHSRRVEQAAFAVLKTPDIPSLLVETGFISNPGEAKKLSSNSYQEKMAKAIFTGVHTYYQEKAPEGTYIYSKYHQKRIAKVYVVRSGDTLSAIAQRFSVSTSVLKRHNKLRSDTLYVGQKINIPASK